MTLKREVIDRMIAHGINKFVLIGENVMNFHSSDDCYYEEWYEDVAEDGGWIVMLSLAEQSKYDFTRAGIDRYVQLIELLEWRPFTPMNLFTKIDNSLLKRLDKF
jgi:hypothetical protein